MIRNEKGATLIELILVGIIVAIIAFIVGDSLVMGLRAYFVAEDRVEATEKGRIAMERLEREIRNAILISNATADASNLCFNDVYGRTVSFRYGGNQIVREEWTPANIGGCPGAGGISLADEITAFSFGYINGSGPQPMPDNSTMRVGISATSASGSESIEFETEAYPVNVW